VVVPLADNRGRLRETDHGSSLPRGVMGPSRLNRGMPDFRVSYCRVLRVLGDSWGFLSRKAFSPFGRRTPYPKPPPFFFQLVRKGLVGARTHSLPRFIPISESCPRCRIQAGERRPSFQQGTSCLSHTPPGPFFWQRRPLVERRPR
jgi:hypothetical protein